MATSREILLIDDDETFCDNLRTYFCKQDLPVAVISDSSVASAIDFRKFKVLLLDLDMPAVSGLEIVQNLPSEQRPVVIVVSGHNDFETRMQLLDQGADFFIAKPVELEELCLIAKRALGRATTTTDATADWQLHRARHSLTTPGGETFGLSSTEFRVLERLFQNAHDATSKNDLVEAATGRAGPVGTHQVRSLEVMISRMRARFGASSAFPVKSLRNVGYIFHSNGTILE